MASHGGYREPSNPAQVSGPGAMSKRTDGGQVNMDLPNAQYGENSQFRDIQSGAPVASAQGQPNGLAQQLMSQLTPINAPSAQPGTPVTDGAQYGPGVGPEALMGANPLAEEALQFAQSGRLALMIQVADSDEGTPSFRAYVRQLVAALPVGK
jgi:hypothetical protein